MHTGKCPFSGKLIYPSRSDAREALRKLATRRCGHKTEQSYYPCPICKGWHLTCQTKSEKSSIRAPRLAPHRRWRWSGRVPEEE